VIDFWAGFAMDYGLGLRFPMEVGLTSPDLVFEGSNFLPSSYVNGLNWSAADYQSVGIAPEDGNEFVMRFTFRCGIFLEVAGIDVIDLGINESEDVSSSFATPFGPGAYFPLPSLDLPIWNIDVGVAYLELGFRLQPNLGSDRITAVWQATGDFAGSGSITYSAPLSSVSFGPINAYDGPSQTDLQIAQFRYYFTQFLIEMSAYFFLDVFGIWDGDFEIPITDFNLSSLTEDLYIGTHQGTSGSIFKTTYVENVPPTAEIDRTATVPVNGVDTFFSHIGTPMTFTGYATDPGADDLYLSWDWDDGPPFPDVTTFYPIPYIVTETQNHTFTDGCLYNISFSATDDDGGYAADYAPVIITGQDSIVRNAGYWQKQIGYQIEPPYLRNRYGVDDRGNVGRIDFDDASLECYLATISHVSTVFNEARDASTIEAAFDVLFLENNQGTPIEHLDRALLSVWLNFTNGGIDYDTLIDTDDDGVGDTPFYEVVMGAEATRLDPNATLAEIKAQVVQMHRIFSMVK
jgi:hypothetical protein